MTSSFELFEILNLTYFIYFNISNIVFAEIDSI